LVEKSARPRFPPHSSLTSRRGSRSLSREVIPGGTRLLLDAQFLPDMAIKNLLVACSIIRPASRSPPIRQCPRVSVVSPSSTEGMRRPYNTPFYSSSVPVKPLRPKPPQPPCVFASPRDGLTARGASYICQYMLQRLTGDISPLCTHHLTSIRLFALAGRGRGAFHRAPWLGTTRVVLFSGHDSAGIRFPQVITLQDSDRDEK
jgi:hypothetical protein